MIKLDKDKVIPSALPGTAKAEEEAVEEDIKETGTRGIQDEPEEITDETA